MVTYDGTTLRWYVDGALSTTKKENFPENNGKASSTLGRGADYGNNDLDEVAIYATALSTPYRGPLRRRLLAANDPRSSLR